MINPIASFRLQPAENHGVNGRQIRASIQPDGAHIEIHIVVLFLRLIREFAFGSLDEALEQSFVALRRKTELAIEAISGEAAGASKRADINDAAIWPNDFMIIRKNVPKTFAKQFADFAFGLNRRGLIFGGDFFA